MPSPVDLAASFSVCCLTKPKPPPGANSSGDRAIGGRSEQGAAPSQAPTASASAQASPPITYEDVVQELNTANADVAGAWSFAPYPACSRAQLLQVHAYWVAVPRHERERAAACDPSEDRGCSLARGGAQAEATATSASLECADGSDATSQPARRLHESDSDAPSFACVVGVVWVRLSFSSGRGVALRAAASSAGSVEGYLQVVLTHPRYRRRGLATWLLHACLATATAPAGVFAADRLDAGDSAPYQIARWHLHTLAAPSLRTGARKRSRDGDGGGAAEEPPASSEHASIAAATILMYRRLGFEERRYLARYYAGQDDAVELVKTCAGGGRVRG